MTRVGILIGVYGVLFLVMALDIEHHTQAEFNELMKEPHLISVALVYVAMATSALYALVGSAHSAMKRFRDRVTRARGKGGAAVGGNGSRRGPWCGWRCETLNGNEAAFIKLNRARNPAREETLSR